MPLLREQSVFASVLGMSVHGRLALLIWMSDSSVNGTEAVVEEATHGIQSGGGEGKGGWCPRALLRGAAPAI